MTSNTLSSCTSSEVRGVAWNKDAWRIQLRVFDKLDHVGNWSRWLKFHFFFLRWVPQAHALQSILGVKP